jgi:hypothetical protein
MESNSEKESEPSISSSIEQSIIDAPVRRFDLKAYQSLTSVMNNPNPGIMTTLMEYMS